MIDSVELWFLCVDYFFENAQPRMPPRTSPTPPTSPLRRSSSSSSLSSSWYWPSSINSKNLLLILLILPLKLFIEINYILNIYVTDSGTNSLTNRIWKWTTIYSLLRWTASKHIWKFLITTQYQIMFEELSVRRQIVKYST